MLLRTSHAKALHWKSGLFGFLCYGKSEVKANRKLQRDFRVFYGESEVVGFLYIEAVFQEWLQAIRRAGFMGKVVVQYEGFILHIVLREFERSLYTLDTRVW